MEHLQCKACGSLGMVPVEIEGDEQEALATLGDDQESRFFTCHVCGDNWLSVKKTEFDGDCEITFVHQMGMQPTLKRTAHMATPVVLNERTVDEWSYYLGDDEVRESEWHRLLGKRRALLRAICTN